jgi:hypothetical protein
MRRSAAEPLLYDRRGLDGSGHAATRRPTALQKHRTSDPKGPVMHVGAVGEIPDLVVRPTWEAMATERI